MTTLEGNKLIAEFHGWNHASTPKGKGEGIWNFPAWGKASWDENSFMYRTSWDWLMPVVKKIESTKFVYCGEKIHFFTFQITAKFCLIEFHTGTRQPGIVYQSEYGEEPDSKISEVWNAVVNFIQWHNQNKPA